LTGLAKTGLNVEEQNLVTGCTLPKTNLYIILARLPHEWFSLTGNSPKSPRPELAYIQLKKIVNPNIVIVRKFACTKT